MSKKGKIVSKKFVKNSKNAKKTKKKQEILKEREKKFKN